MISTLFGKVNKEVEEKSTDRKVGVFDMINSITTTKNYMFDDETAKEYAPWIVNKSLSAFPELLYHVDRMNTFSHLSPKMQYDYYFHAVPKNKRYKKWLKKEKNPEEKYIAILSEKLNYSYRKAETAWSLMSKEQKKQFVDTYIDKNKK